MPPTDDHDYPLVALQQPFVDDRGYIQPLVDSPMASALLITGNKGKVRGNHSHRTDWHYCYVVSGSMEYHWRPAGTSEKPRTVTVKRGQMVFSPPGVDHAFRFLEDTAFLTLAGNPRDEETYEADTIRVSLIADTD